MFYHVWYKFPNEIFVVIPVVDWPVIEISAPRGLVCCLEMVC